MGRNCPSKGLGKGVAPQLGKGAPQLADKGKGKGMGVTPPMSKGVPGKGTPAGKGVSPSVKGKGMPGIPKGVGKGGFTFQGSCWKC
eukprot:2947921-Karenia_brevis.AAC.1